MRIDTLEDLYLEQLKDIYSANEQALDITKKMTDAASDADLGNALQAGAGSIRGGLAALEQMAQRHDEHLGGALCKGMKGLAIEAHAQALAQPFGDPATKDAMIITQFQHLAHYAIAGYGCLIAFADRLELDDDLASLKDCLDAAYVTDRTMTQLATGRRSNDART
nr:DUF892 family protein [uncultured Tateyamaria sp.]